MTVLTELTAAELRITLAELSFVSVMAPDVTVSTSVVVVGTIDPSSVTDRVEYMLLLIRIME